MRTKTTTRHEDVPAFAVLDALCDVFDANQLELLPDSLVIARGAIATACSYRRSEASMVILEDLANTLSDVASEARRNNVLDLREEPRDLFDGRGVRLTTSDGWSL